MQHSKFLADYVKLIWHSVITKTHGCEHRLKISGNRQTIYQLLQVYMHITSNWTKPNRMAYQSQAPWKRYFDSGYVQVTKQLIASIALSVFQQSSSERSAMA